MVSNHAGVVIDYAAHPLEVLPEIKKVIGNRMPIFVDSGFRRGSDVMKALALGADAVLVGWALVMGLAANGSQGVTEMVDILTAELQRIMSVTGSGGCQISRVEFLWRGTTTWGADLTPLCAKARAAGKQAKGQRCRWPVRITTIVPTTSSPGRWRL